MKNSKVIRGIIAAMTFSALICMSGCSSASAGQKMEPVLEKVDTAEMPADTAADAQAQQDEENRLLEETLQAAQAAQAGETQTQETAESPAVASAEDLSGSHQRRFAPEKSAFEQKLEEAPAPAPAEETQQSQPVEPETAPADFVPYEGPDMSICFKIYDSTAVDWKPVAYQQGYPETEAQVESLLEQLSYYWQRDEKAAVDDLVRLPRFRYMSQQLKGTREYFYWGDEDENRMPNGTGVAVYANNQYYFGQFENGLRSGQGTWFQVFNKEGDFSRKNNGVYYHSYTGTWENNLPCGEGHEHLSINSTYLSMRIVTNVMGSFRNGLYDGKVYLITENVGDDIQEWDGTAELGKFTTFAEAKSYDENRLVPVARSRYSRDDYLWMKEDQNILQGVTGLIH